MNVAVNAELFRKVEALYIGGATAGERAAAKSVRDKLLAKHDILVGNDLAEMEFHFDDEWSLRVFMTLCRCYGVEPYRYSEQSKTTVMVVAQRKFFRDVVQRRFAEVQEELEGRFEKFVAGLATETSASNMFFV